MNLKRVAEACVSCTVALNHLDSLLSCKGFKKHTIRATNRSHKQSIDNDANFVQNYKWVKGGNGSFTSRNLSNAVNLNDASECQRLKEPKTESASLLLLYSVATLVFGRVHFLARHSAAHGAGIFSGFLDWRSKAKDGPQRTMFGSAAAPPPLGCKSSW